ncbi:hypothetical protein P152DRAFT_390622 [Eremomyces bilateralis CBS 781.70]|uniref:P-loop containing nucleoside triphosphate hydrolase protein n=1 Tax=Eremomyces bilateralis CBS 781.70 TaxID=1392243 RepID=A0A6G1GCQ6_9PEZI|nr:uncharacterized protein P152DRAFT_390622 [Eremomyces bilateralis CBS 781.70]KAF1815867.1 hypothetical protein P152DRAFT_390622 [Eremomyces bilateralis CBS 781.70]
MEEGEKDLNPDFEKKGDPERPLSNVLAKTTSAYTSGFSENGDEGATSQKAAKRTWGERLNPLKHKVLPPVPEEREVSREYTAGFFSKLTFQWIAPLMSVGYQRTVEVQDLWKVNPTREVDHLANTMNEHFKRRVEEGKKRPLVGAMYDTFKKDFLTGAVCQFFGSIIMVVNPFILRYLIQFAGEAYAAQKQDLPEPHIGRGVGLVLGISGLQLVQTICINHFLYRGMMNGGESRAVLMALIFDKAMRLSGRAKAGGKSLETPPPEVKPGSEEEKAWYRKLLKKKRKEPTDNGSENGQGWSNGRIVNLMSSDTYRIDTASGFFHMLWSSPMIILITLALLLINLTYSALAGFGLIIISMPILGRTMRILFHRREAINKITDQRVGLTQEILQAVRFVKFFGWEKSFLARLNEIRKREILSIQVLLAIRNAINAVSMSMPVFAAMLAFITYSLSNHVLDPAPIFSSLALFNSLRLPLNFLPLVIGQVIDALSSIGRIQEFLLEEEVHDDCEWDYEHKNAIVLEHADFTWERTPTQESEEAPEEGSRKEKKAAKKAAKKVAKEAEKKAEATGPDTANESASTLAEDEPFKIYDMDIAVGRNELIGVIGTVGSGKSSLLAALAGDMRKTAGKVVMGASRAFCPQYAWIQNATVRDNIVFSKDFDRTWYDKVIDACALRPDFEMLPGGDQTEIGERGITVSGGQKQRLNIARAIYFNADIVIMDDPLSAVDAHVGRHIMDQAICGLLKDKCRILATHQLHVLNRCDRIVWLQEGRVAALDTFPNLMQHNEDFQKMMLTTAVEKEEESVDEDEIEEDKKQPKKKTKKHRPKGLMQAEERAVKSVSWGVWFAFIKAGGGYWVAPLVFIFLAMAQASNILTNLWLSWWTSGRFGLSQGQYIGVYAGLGFSQAVVMFLFSVSLSVFGTEASKKMLARAITKVLRAPMSFFDTTPLGRITNRFSKDVDTLDNNLTDAMRMFYLSFGMIISVFALIISFFPYFAVALVPLLTMFLFSAAYYRSSAREVKRHEALLRSFVFAKFSEGVSGTATIRAYGLQDKLSQEVRKSIDNMNSAYYLTFANQRWLSMRLDIVGILLVFTVGILVVTNRFDVEPSTGALVLSYILSIVQMIQFTVRQLAEVENNMNSAERLHYYGTEIEEEAPLHAVQVRPTWPEHGEIIFDEVQMRYRAGLPLVLKGLNMHVKAGERIGVVGRTGAGKSSIMSTLFRLTELSGGTISIDGVDISQVGLYDLRSRLAIIPQDPTLFRGTIRTNLDPFNEHNDLELWTALRQAHLVDAEATMDDRSGRIQLDGIVEEEGLNYSLGQRQLMALARALVRNSQIIVCDEATSSVDMETDQKIQHTIATGFYGKTLLCIAHRLKTIIGYDRICVMDNGQISELEAPLVLYDREESIFRSLCERSGITREHFFQAKAEMGEL